MLILLDLLLVLVLGLVLYSISARDCDARPTLMDAVQLVLVVSALVIDALALAAMLGRITEFGFTPEPHRRLGLNVILLANLVWSAWLLSPRPGRRPFSELERWQTRHPRLRGLGGLVVVCSAALRLRLTARPPLRIASIRDETGPARVTRIEGGGCSS